MKSCTRSCTAQKTPKCEIWSHEEYEHATKAHMATMIECVHANPASLKTQLRRAGKELRIAADWELESCQASIRSVMASNEKAAVTGEASSVNSSTCLKSRTYR